MPEVPRHKDIGENAGSTATMCEEHEGVESAACHAD